jgi:hypothetical protein
MIGNSLQTSGNAFSAQVIHTANKTADLVPKGLHIYRKMLATACDPEGVEHHNA